MKWSAVVAFIGCFTVLGLASESAGAKTGLTVEQVLAKYAAARGGAEAWRNVQTMVWNGHIQAGNSAAVGAGFVMSFKRPNMTRFEVSGPGQKAAHIFDGARGWKVRQPRTGAPELQDYTSEELSFARDALGLDGPLMDYKTKGVVVTLAGLENIEGQKAYCLNVTLPSGATRRTWIDAHTFLEVRYDRETESAHGQPGTVSVYYRNYKAFDGLQVPMTIETHAGKGDTLDRMVIDRVIINPPLTAQTFVKPRMPDGNAAAPGMVSPMGGRPAAQPGR